MLLGDAAHAVTPVFGQGANSSLESCQVCAGSSERKLTPTSHINLPKHSLTHTHTFTLSLLLLLFARCWARLSRPARATCRKSRPPLTRCGGQTCTGCTRSTARPSGACVCVCVRACCLIQPAWGVRRHGLLPIPYLCPWSHAPPFPFPHVMHSAAFSAGRAPLTLTSSRWVCLVVGCRDRPSP